MSSPREKLRLVVVVALLLAAVPSALAPPSMSGKQQML
jgi:hypothetical protein